jgi:hypothetical protein
MFMNEGDHVVNSGKNELVWFSEVRATWDSTVDHVIEWEGEVNDGGLCIGVALGAGYHWVAMRPGVERWGWEGSNKCACHQFHIDVRLDVFGEVPGRLVDRKSVV